MRSGIKRYKRSVEAGPDVFLLRRNIHRLEKGLTMRPVRPQFATDYIRPTVHSFLTLRSAEVVPRHHPEYLWMESVLVEYFRATRPSDHPQIVAARAAFEAIGTSNDSHGPQPVKPGGNIVDVEALHALAEARRSVRWFLDKPVPRDDVDRAVAIGAESPTACNRQPYRFEIFDDPVSASRVAEIPMGADGYAQQVPGIIVIIGDLSAFFDPRDRHVIYIDSCLAAMGLVYGLEAQGVASCCINWPDLPEREHEMRQLIGLEQHERVIMLIAYGYADESALAPLSAKRVIDEVRRYRTL